MVGPGDRDGTATPSGLPSLLATAVAAAASLLVFGAYAVRAAALVRYPFDWSPDEGLFLGFARLFLQGPALLYHKSWVPLPDAYGPVFPALLAPIVALFPEPFPPARALAAVSTAIGSWAVYRLVRVEGSPLLALASVALALAPFDLTFWHILVRVDGLMTTLWLLAAVVLLPRRLERGSEILSFPRILGGTALLLAAVLTKPTAALHGAPIVLGWLLVDRRSALRLIAVLGGAGLATVALLQVLTSGAYLWIHSGWSQHPTTEGLLSTPLRVFSASTAPLTGLALVGFAIAFVRGTRPGRDPGLLLVLGGLAIVPALGKYGAYWNYLLPALPALAVVTGRWWGRVAASLRDRVPHELAAAVVASVALALAATRHFPVPGPQDALTTGTFYSFVGQFTQRFGGPILASRPDYAYFVAHQPVEVEGSGFPILAAIRGPGSERVLERLRTPTYTMLIEAWSFPAAAGYREAIAGHYRVVGGCFLALFFGGVDAHFYVRQDIEARFTPPAGTRCWETPAPAPAEPGSGAPPR